MVKSMKQVRPVDIYMLGVFLQLDLTGFRARFASKIEPGLRYNSAQRRGQDCMQRTR